MRKNFIAAAAVLMLPMIGAHVALANEPTEVVSISDGSTTKSEVRAALGNPVMTGVTKSGYEQWHYELLGRNATVEGATFIPTYGPLHHYILPTYGDIKPRIHGAVTSLDILFKGNTVIGHREKEVNESA